MHDKTMADNAIISNIRDIFTLAPLLLAGIFILFTFKSVAAITLLLLLDFIKCYIKAKFKFEIPFDFGLFTVILAGYSGKPMLSFLIVFILAAIRIMNGLTSRNHLIEFPLLIAISFMASYLTILNFAILGVMLVLFKFVIEHFLESLVFSTTSQNKLFIRIMHVFISYIGFLFFGACLVGMI